MKKLLFGALLVLTCSFACATGPGFGALAPITQPIPNPSPVTRHSSLEPWRFAKSDSEAMALAGRELRQPLIPLASVAGPTNGGVVYGNGTHLAQTSAPTTGYLLQGNSSGAPTWAALGSLITAGAGISISGTTAVTIAAALTAGPGISISGSTISNSGVTSNVAGTGVSVSSATGASTISIGQSVATTASPTFATELLDPSTFTNGLTVKYPNDNGGASGLLLEDNSSNTMFSTFWGANGKLTIAAYALSGASTNQATLQLGTAPNTFATNGNVVSNYLVVDNGSGSAVTCGDLGFYASQTHTTTGGSAYGTDLAVQLTPNNASTLSNVAWFRSSGDVELNGAESVLGPTAPGPFPYGPSMAGVPTGIPNGHAGQQPIGLVDTADKVSFYYNGSGWSDGSGGVYTPVSTAAAITSTTKIVGLTVGSIYTVTLPSAASYQGREIIFVLVSGSSAKLATIQAGTGDSIINAAAASPTMGTASAGPSYSRYMRLISIGGNAWYFAGGA